MSLNSKCGDRPRGGGVREPTQCPLDVCLWEDVCQWEDVLFWGTFRGCSPWLFCSLLQSHQWVRVKMWVSEGI